MTAIASSVPAETDPEKLLARSFGYASLSFLALFSGFANFHRLDFPSTPLLLIPFGISLGFFSAYSVVFHPRPRAHPLPNETIVFERKWFMVVVLFGVLLAVIGGVKIGIRIANVPIPLLITLASYSFATLGYGVFLLWRYAGTQTSHRPIRYQLIFPILLSITVPLYVGLNITSFDSWQSLYPLASLALYFLVARLARSRTLLLVASSGFLILAIGIAMWWPTLRPFTDVFLFATAVSAYAAVFESWNVTNRAAYLQGSWSGYPERCYYATFAALVISIFSAAILFAFTSKSSTLLVFFGIHSIVSLTVWYAVAPPSLLLIGRRHWWAVKGVLGLVVLLALGTESLIPSWTLTTTLFINPVTVTVYILVFNLLAAPVRVPVMSPPTAQSFVDYYSAEPRNLLKHMFLILMVGLAILFGLSSGTPSVTTAVANRASNSFLLFAVYAVITLICLLWSNGPMGPSSPVQRLLEKILGLLITLRLFCSTVVGGTVSVIAYLHGSPPVVAASVGLPFLLACMGGFALNDYFDVEKDRTNRPYRALPRGLLAPRTVLAASMVLLAVSGAVGLAAAESLVDLSLYGGTIVGLVAYNAILRRAAVLKAPYTGFLSSLPFIFVAVKFGRPAALTVFPLTVALFITGRELWMDIHDVDGDRRQGIRTLPLLIGDVSASWIGCAALMLGSLLLLPAAYDSGRIVSWFLVGATLGLCSALIILWATTRRRWGRQIIYACWMPMILGLMLLLSTHAPRP